MDAQQQQQPHDAEGTAQCKTCHGDDGEGSASSAVEGQDKLTAACSNCQVFKSGPLFISSKGLGWTSWKKRWFTLTRTSLMFFRSDPNAPNQRGNEGNLTLGGIELNNSGSVVVRADKKLLTVLFPDGRDGRAFTLKAETSEDLHDWKTALENALAQAPSAALVLGQNSIFRSDSVDAVESTLEQGKDDGSSQSTIIGRPACLALEDVDGRPSFLEKALRFIEQHGIKTEGILRQSADVEEVKHRFKEYEQGKNEFSPDEDAHLIADCIKYVLREMPSSPVPASCCAALLEALRGDRGARVNHMYTAIHERFPEPNRLLLKRILEMMRTAVSHKSVNRMSVSAVAACMAPLLLRPLLAGDCELDGNFNMGGDGSLQLLQAAAAANHAQAIVIILLEEYDRIFSEDFQGSSSEVYSDSDDAYYDEDDEYEYEDSTDDEAEDDDGYDDTHKDSDSESEDDNGQLSGEASTESKVEADPHKEKDGYNSETTPSKECDDVEINKKALNVPNESSLQQAIEKDLPDLGKTKILQLSAHCNDESLEKKNDTSTSEACESHKTSEAILTSHLSTKPAPLGQIDVPTKSASNIRRRTGWGRTAAKKNLSMELVEYVSEEEEAIQKLENTKIDLQCKLTEEVKENERLQASLERRKQVLRERQMALQHDVERLQEQLQKERNFRATVEAELANMPRGLPISSSLDQKTRADLEEIAHAEADISNLNKKVSDLKDQLDVNQQSDHVSSVELPQELEVLSNDRNAKSDEESFLSNDTNVKPDEEQFLSNDPNAKFEEESSLRKSKTNFRLQNSTDDGNGVSSKDLSLTKVNATAKELSKGEVEDVLLGEKSMDARTAQLHCLNSQQSGETVRMQLNRSSNQNGTGNIGVISSSSLTESSSMEAKMVSYACSNDENPSLGATAGLDSTHSKSLPSLPNKLQKLNPILSTEKRGPATKLGSSLLEEPYASGEVSISDNSNKRENMLAEASSSKNIKPQAQELAAFQPQGGKQPSKQLDKVRTQGSTNTLDLNSSSYEKTSLSRPDALPQKFNNAALGTNSGHLNSQQFPVSPPLRRRQPVRKPISRLGNLTTISPLVAGTSSLPTPEGPVNGAVGASKRPTIQEASSSTSALNRLTNRLNFLKERRMQLASELRNMDLGRSKTLEGPAPSKPDTR